MKKKIFFVSSFIFIILNCLILTVKAEGELKPYKKTYFQYFDTILEITLYAQQEVPESHWDEIEDIIIAIENTFSRSDVDSELYQLNATAGTNTAYQVSEDLYTVIKTSVGYAEKTNGKFEPTIAPLIDLWGPIGEITAPPTHEQIEAIKPLIDYQKIILNDSNRTIELTETGMGIDLGSISKGYAADLLTDKISELGYDHALINLGVSSISLVGGRPLENTYGNHNWVVGVTNPQRLKGEDGYIGLIQLNNQTITSSATDKRLWVDVNTNKTYHHILDPETGFPVNNIVQQVTVITDNAMTGDAMSTSLLAVGIKKGLELVNTMEGVDVIYVTYNREMYVSSGIGTTIPFEITNETFVIKDISALKDENEVIHYKPERNIKKPLFIALGIIGGTGALIGAGIVVKKKYF